MCKLIFEKKKKNKAQKAHMATKANKLTLSVVLTLHKIKT
jgi:hypothetical protein